MVNVSFPGKIIINVTINEGVTSHDSLSLAESYVVEFLLALGFHALHLISRPLFYDSRLYKVVTYQMKLGKPRCRHKYTFQTQ